MKHIHWKYLLCQKEKHFSINKYTQNCLYTDNVYSSIELDISQKNTPYYHF